MRILVNSGGWIALRWDWGRGLGTAWELQVVGCGLQIEALLGGGSCRLLVAGRRLFYFGRYALDRRWTGVEIEQSLADGLSDETANFWLAMEFYFALGWMNIDVHGRRIDFEEQAANRIAPLHQ